MVNGSEMVVLIEWDGEFLPIGCTTSDSFTESSTMLSTTTQDNEGWETSVPTNQKYSFTVDGLLINTHFNGGDFNKISHDRLTYLKRNRFRINWRSETLDKEFVSFGQGYINNLSNSASVNEYITFSASIEGYGKPTNTSEKSFNITDGNGNNITDGQNSNIVTK